MLNKEKKPTLVLSDHPPLQRMIPVLMKFLAEDRQGVIVADHSMTAIANIFGIDLIPVVRDLSKLDTQTKTEAYKQKILAVFGSLSGSKTQYEHQGQQITQQVLTALKDRSVFMAPSGTTNRVSSWKPGVSHIISEASDSMQDFAVSFLYIPDSFKQQFAFQLFDSWTRILDSENLDWSDDHRQNASNLQQFYEGLRS